MEALHVFLSNEVFSAKVISLQDIFFILAIITICYYLKCYLKPLAVSKRNKAHAALNVKDAAKGERRQRQSRRSVAPRQHIVSISQSIHTAIEAMVNSQYVLKDRTQYRSVFQTPLKDNLHQLRCLANELERNAMPINSNGESPTVKRAEPIKGVRTAPVNTSYVLMDIVPGLQDYAALQGMKLSLYENASAYLNVNAGLVDKMLRELVLNAIKHNQAGTDITLTCSFANGLAIFEVGDNGNGISSSITNKVNAIANNTRLRNRRLSDAESYFSLTTIGEMTCKLGGSLEITSALGLRTEVRISLPTKPIMVCRHEKALPYQVLTVQKPINERKYILYVGKHPHGANIMHSLFNGQYNVFTYTHFDQALKSIFMIEPDLVIADFSWQPALCIQFCAFIRGSKTLSNVPFISINSAMDQVLRAKMYANGISAIVEKPLDVNELSAVADNLMSNHSVLRDEINEKDAVYEAVTERTEPSYRCSFVQDIARVIEQGYRNESFNRFEASDSLHMSEKTLQRRMTKHFAMSFTQYLRKYRLEKAKEQLIKGECVTNVTFDVGFNSSSYFGQCFKQEYGYPPSMLKETH
jgi:AraC-like DNA-binding protein